ncbi:NINE protein [Chloroflexota bacterium]
MYCPQCGDRVSYDWQVCPHCSAPLVKNDRQTQQPRAIAHSSGVFSETSIKAPSPWFYGVGAAIIVIPFVVAMVLLFVDLFGSTPDTRFVVPGIHELDFDDTGKYTLFYEFKSSVDGWEYSTGEYLKSVKVSIESEDDTRSVKMSSASGDMSYEIGSRAGKSLFEFEIEEPGTYIVTTEYRDGTSTPEVVFAIGPSFDILGNILRSFGIGFAGFVLGTLVLVWVFLKRRKVRNEMGVEYSNGQMAAYVSPKSRLAVTLLSFFLGQFGAHRFYLDKIGTGILMLVSFGGFGIWVLIDLIMAVCGEMKDKDGKPITRW